MRLTTDRKILVNTLKVLKALCAKGTDPRFTDLIVLNAQTDGLRLYASTGFDFVSVLLEAEVQEEGTCSVSFKFYDLLKAVKDEQAKLSYRDSFIVSTKSGLKATLTTVDKIIPTEALGKVLEQGIEASVVVETNSIINLAEISNVFSPVTNIRWVDVVCNDNEVYGTVQGSDYGVLERLPMEGQGDNYEFTFRPDHVAPILAFCGERVRLSAINNSNGIYLLQDPDDDSWWAAVRQVDKQKL